MKLPHNTLDYIWTMHMKLFVSISKGKFSMIILKQYIDYRYDPKHHENFKKGSISNLCFYYRKHMSICNFQTTTKTVIYQL